MDKALPSGGSDWGFESPHRRFFLAVEKSSPGGTRTLNLLLRKQTPYPLGYKATTTKKGSTTTTKKGSAPDSNREEEREGFVLEEPPRRSDHRRKPCPTSNQHGNKTKTPKAPAWSVWVRTAPPPQRCGPPLRAESKIEKRFRLAAPTASD